MKAIITCPDSDTLVAMLDAKLPDEQFSQVEKHVNGCASCQARLDELVTDGLRDDLCLEELVEGLGSAPNRPSGGFNWSVEKSTTRLVDHHTVKPEGTSTVSLDFLEPSEESDSLGRLGRYEITEVIARGGMGIALKGRDTLLNRIVAVKVLAPELALSPTARKRFLREAQAAAAVSHDHVVTTYSVEPCDLPYLAMEFIEGQSLQQKIDREGSLEVREILRIGMQTAYGLAAAHAQGLIHRDIKPSNIMLQNSIERVQITDFGLARAVDDASITRSGEVAGTPQYMAPEQIDGGTIDHRADLFSLGSVMHAMCTGRSPFRAESTAAVLRRVCDDTPRAIREVNPEVPDWLAGIIGRLLEKDPAGRFQTAAELADLLSQCLAHVQQPAVIPLPDVLAARSRTRSRVSRTKWHIGAILLTVVFGSLGMTEATGVTQFSASVIGIVRGDGTLMVEVDDPGVSVVIEGEDLIITGAGPKEVRLRPGDYRLQAEKDGEPVPIEQELVSIHRGDRRLVRVRLQSDMARSTGSVTEVRRLTGHAAQVRSVCFSADGKQCLSAAFDGTLRLWNVQTGKVVRLIDAGKWLTATDISRDGKIAAAGDSEGRLALWDMKTGTILHELVGHSGEIKRLQFSPDDRFLVSRGVTTLRVWNVDTGAESQRVMHRYEGSSALDYSPDGETLVLGDKTDIVLRELESGREIWRVQERCNIIQACFSPDGQLLATTGSAHSIDIRDVRTGDLVGKLRGHRERSLRAVPPRFDFSRDGRHLISVSHDNSMRIWLIGTQCETHRIDLGEAYPNSIAVSPDGRSVLTAGGARWDHESRAWVYGSDYDLHLWQLPESVWPERASIADYQSIPAGAISEARRLSARGSFVHSLAFASDGQHLLAGRGYPAVQYWDLEKGIFDQFAPDKAVTSAGAVAVSPDGRLAAVAAAKRVEEETVNSLQIWEIRTGRLLHEIPAGRGFWCVSFSADGQRLIAGDADGTGSIVDMESGDVRHCVECEMDVYFCQFSAERRTALFGSDELILVDVESGQESLRLDPPGESATAAISPDGQFIAAAFSKSAADDSHPIQLFDVETGEVRKRFIGHTSLVRELSFLPDGRHIVSGSYDKTLRVWNVATGEEVARVETDNHVTHRIAVSPDGRSIASAGGHFRKKPDYQLRSHETLGNNSNYVHDGDNDIRLWQLPEKVWPELSPLEREIAEYQRIIAEKSNDPTAQRQVAEAYYEIGNRLVSLDRITEAEKAYLRAIDLFEPIVSQNQQHLETRLMEAELYYALAGARRSSLSIDTVRSAIEIAEKVRADFSDDPMAIHRVLRCVTRLIQLMGDTGENRERLEHCLSLAESTDMESAPGMMAIYLELRALKAQFLTNDGEYDAAVEILQSVVERRRERNVSHPGGMAGREHLYSFVSQLVRTLLQAGREEEAADTQKEVVEVLAMQVADYPDVAIYKRHLREETERLAALQNSKDSEPGVESTNEAGESQPIATEPDASDETPDSPSP